MKVKLNISNKNDYHILQVMYETTKMTIKELSKEFNVPEQKIIKLKTDHHWFRTKERKLEYLRNPTLYEPLILQCIYADVRGQQVEIINHYVKNVKNKLEEDLQEKTVSKSYITVKVSYKEPKKIEVSKGIVQEVYSENISVPATVLDDIYFVYKDRYNVK